MKLLLKVHTEKTRNRNLQRFYTNSNQQSRLKCVFTNKLIKFSVH